MIKQLPISLNGARKGEVRTQFAALCYRVKKGRIQVLLVTSRGTKRWIVPKGWPMHGKTPAECAAQEAWEEGGVIGKAEDACVGVYSYAKYITDDDELPCLAMLYPLRVKSLAKHYPERDERRRQWMSPKRAAERVQEAELAQLILDFVPRGVKLRS